MSSPPRAPGTSIREVAVQPPAPDQPGSPDAEESDSNDYRYIQVRRTLIYVEQAIKAALDPFVFSHNTPATWTSVVSAVSAALQQIWAEGKLAGATPEEAFSVHCGLGSTMTPQDVAAGNLVVEVRLSGLEPAATVLTVRLTLAGA